MSVPTAQRIAGSTPISSAVSAISESTTCGCGGRFTSTENLAGNCASTSTNCTL